MNQKNNAHHRRFFVKGLIILLLLGMNYLMFSFLLLWKISLMTTRAAGTPACWN